MFKVVSYKIVDSIVLVYTIHNLSAMNSIKVTE